MAARPPELKPEIQGFLVHWEFSEARDKRLLAEMFEKARTAGIVLEKDDKRLLPITRLGRRRFDQALREVLPTLLPGSAAGGAAAFLDAFELRGTEPVSTDGLRTTGTVRVTAALRIPIQDPLTSNLHHSRWRTTCVSVANQWTREFARMASRLVDDLPRTEYHTGVRLPSGPVWVSDPDTSLAVLGVALPISEVRGAVGVTSPAGVIVIDPTGYEIDTREVHDRWEILAMCQASVWLDPSKVLLVDVEGIEYAASIA